MRRHEVAEGEFDTCLAQEVGWPAWKDDPDACGALSPGCVPSILGGLVADTARLVRTRRVPPGRCCREGVD